VIRKGALVRIDYSGKPYYPGKTGGSMENDQGYPGDSGKLALNLYSEPHVTSAGTFWMVMIGEDPRMKLIHEEYLEVIDGTR